MMNQQQPDNFFREKLENYRKPAPAGAWDRIESTLEKKTDHRFGWRKIAASFLLLAGAIYVLWFFNATPVRQPLAEKENKIESVPEKPIENKIDRSKDSLQPKVEDSQPKIIDTPKKSGAQKTQTKNSVTPPIQEVAAPEQEENTYSDISETVIPSVATRRESIQKSSITITITADETNQYLDKNALAQATSEEKKSSTFKKLLKKANDLKSNQDPFGDLREKKNEILALNFKNEKRGQNK